MDIERFYTTPVTIVAPGVGEDRYGNEQTDWDAATRTDTLDGLPLLGWLFWPEGSEVLAHRDTTVSSPILRLPADAPVTAACRIEAEGLVFDVFGRPAVKSRPDGPHHVRVDLRYFAEIEAVPLAPDGDVWLWPSGDEIAWPSGDLIGLA